MPDVLPTSQVIDATEWALEQLAVSESERAALESALNEVHHPMLFIGLGGTGCQIVARIKHRWKRLPEKERESRIQFFCLDTLSLSAQETDPIVKSNLSPDTEFLPLIPPGTDLAEYFANQERDLAHSDFERQFGWYDTTLMPKGTQLGPTGAGAFRQFGRLALAHRMPIIRTQLERMAAKLVRADAGGDLGVLHEPLVFVVSGMSGGTGSGIFLDMVRMAHVVLADHSPIVRGILVLPEIFKDSARQASVKERMVPNAYALMKELDYIVTTNRLKREYEKCSLALPGFARDHCPNLEEFLMPVYLIGHNLPDANKTVTDRDKLMDIAGDAAFALTIGLKQDALLSNVVEAMMSSSESGHRRIYAGIGVSRALVPIRSIINHLGLMLFADSVRSVLAAPDATALSAGDLEKVTAVADSIMYTIGAEFDAFARRVLTSATSLET